MKCGESIYFSAYIRTTVMNMLNEITTFIACTKWNTFGSEPFGC